MIRKLFLLALMGVAAFAFTASSASAVVVHNPEMFEISGENTLALVEHHDDVETPVVRCDNDWEANVSADGHVDVHRIDFEGHTGSTVNCLTANDCRYHPTIEVDEGWEAQIFEHFEEPGTDPPSEHEFGVEATFCLVGIQPLLANGAPVHVTCEINANEVHCDETVAHIDLGTEEIRYEVEGELFFDHPLELEHEEA